MSKKLVDLEDELKRVLVNRRKGEFGYIPVEVLAHTNGPRVLIYKTSRGCACQTFEEFLQNIVGVHYLKKWRKPTKKELQSWLIAYSL